MKVLLPVDGAAASLHAARMVAGYGDDRSRVVPTVLNVQAPLLSVWPGAGIDPVVLESALRDQGTARLEAARSMLLQQGFAAGHMVRIGHASDTILDTAHDLGVDAIVMGTRGHG